MPALHYAYLQVLRPVKCFVEVFIFLKFCSSLLDKSSDVLCIFAFADEPVERFGAYVSVYVVFSADAYF